MLFNAFVKLLPVALISSCLLAMNPACAQDDDDSVGAPLIAGGNPTKAEAAFLRGHKALTGKNWKAAEQFYRKAVELDGAEPRYHRQLAVLLLRELRGQESEREALIAERLDEKDWRTKLLIGQIYHAEKRMDEETDKYRDVLKILPPDQKELRDKLVVFIHKDELAVKREADYKKKKSEFEESFYKNAY